MNQAPTPKKITLDKSERRLVILWADGVRASYPWDFLRSHCPSADERVARDERDANPLSILAKIPSSDVVNVRMVGAYALNVAWSDGHDAGIYTWEFLRELAEDPVVGKTALA